MTKLTIRSRKISQYILRQMMKWKQNSSKFMAPSSIKRKIYDNTGLPQRNSDKWFNLTLKLTEGEEKAKVVRMKGQWKSGWKWSNYHLKINRKDKWK